MTRPRQRRRGTIPRHTYWSPGAVTLIDDYQAQQRLPSFSAAAEALVRLGVEQSPTEVITPIIMSAIYKAVHQELERLIRLQLYTAVEVGVAQRFAAAAVRDLGRLKQDDPERFHQIKAAAIADTRRQLARDNIGQVVADLYTALFASGPDSDVSNGEQVVKTNGSGEGELQHAGDESRKDHAEGGEVLHLS